MCIYFWEQAELVFQTSVKYRGIIDNFGIMLYSYMVYLVWISLYMFMYVTTSNVYCNTCKYVN